MNETAALVRCLRKTELVYLKRYLYITSPAKNQLALKLVKLILTTPGPITEKEAAEHLYGAPPDSRMSHLKKRIRNAVFKTFLLQEPEQVFHSAYSQNLFRSMLNVLNIEVIGTRGLRIDLLQNLIKEAKLFAEQNDHLVFYALLASKECDIQPSVPYDYTGELFINDISKALDDYKIYAISKVFYGELLLKLRYKKSWSKEELSLLNMRKVELDQLSLISGSVHFKMIYNAYSTYYSIHIKDYEQAEEYVNVLIETISQNKSKTIKDIERVALALSVKIKVHKSKYNEAIELVNQLLDTYRTKTLYDHLICLELKLVVLINNASIIPAMELIDEIKMHPYYLKNRLFIGHVQLYQSTLLFLQNKKKESVVLLRQNSNLSEDKEGWFLGIKILDIIIALDDKDIDSVDYQYKATRAQLQRYPNANAARLKLILKIVQAFIKTRNHSLAAAMAEAELRLLYAGQNEFYWDPYGFETIRFDTWYLSKATKFKPDWLIGPNTETP